ncbi:hypothetical protein H311_00108 [Anncaliia algerae PRA109]|nr:hypothetical protein H311_00108 [Anncaliia algerae PRA109]
MVKVLLHIIKMENLSKLNKIFLNKKYPRVNYIFGSNFTSIRLKIYFFSCSHPLSLFNFHLHFIMKAFNVLSMPSRIHINKRIFTTNNSTYKFIFYSISRKMLVGMN